MWLYIRHLIQLVLSPTGGWNDISEAARTPEEVQRRGFYPWTALVALSETVRCLYEPDLSVFTALGCALAVAGAMLVTLYLGRLLLDMSLVRLVDGTLNISKVAVFTLYMTGMWGLFIMVSNLVPASLTIVHFLPLLSVLVIFKASAFLGVREESGIALLGWGALATIVAPYVIYALLTLLL